MRSWKNVSQISLSFQNSPNCTMTFQEAQDKVQNLTQKPNNEELLKLYALFKQGTVGDNNEDPPSNPFDFKATAKHNAWKEVAGINKVDAEAQYISKVEELVEKYGLA